MTAEHLYIFTTLIQMTVYIRQIISSRHNVLYCRNICEDLHPQPHWSHPYTYISECPLHTPQYPPIYAKAMFLNPPIPTFITNSASSDRIPSPQPHPPSPAPHAHTLFHSHPNTKPQPPTHPKPRCTPYGGTTTQKRKSRPLLTTPKQRFLSMAATTPCCSTLLIRFRIAIYVR